MQTTNMVLAPRNERNAATAASVSVVIPAYNAVQFLAETIATVHAQTVSPAEIIVVDDGSTDETAALARSLGARVITVVNGGPSAARNVGIRAAASEYIAFLDGDDLWAPDKLAVQLQALQRYNAPAFSFTDYRLFDERGDHTGPTALRRNRDFRRRSRPIPGSADRILAIRGRRPVLCESYILPSSLLVRKADALAIGGFDETLRIAEDYEFLLRLLGKVPGIGSMRSLLRYRRHADQATVNAADGFRSFFEVAQRVASAPERYPEADVRYIARHSYNWHAGLGIELAKRGRFKAALESLMASLRQRWTLRVATLSLVVRVADNKIGARALEVARIIWKRRPGHR